jgi:uncharacterized protein (DUF2345 family)
MQPSKLISLTEELEIKFATGHSLSTNKELGEINITNSKNEIQLTILITAAGIVINANANQLNVNALDQLNLQSKKINIDASDLLILKSGGNFVQEVSKDALTEIKGTNKNLAKTQKIFATTGNIDLKANDNINLLGEQVLLNCE